MPLEEEKALFLFVKTSGVRHLMHLCVCGKNQALLHFSQDTHIYLWSVFADGFHND